MKIVFELIKIIFGFVKDNSIKYKLRLVCKKYRLLINENFIQIIQSRKVKYYFKKNKLDFPIIVKIPNVIEINFKNEVFNISKFNKKNKFFLNIICREGYYELLKYIIKNDFNKVVNINIKDENNDTPLIIACSNNYQRFCYNNKLKNKKINYYNNNNNIYDKNNLKIVKILVEKGAKLNIINQKGYSPLSIACRYNNIYIINFLFEKGCDINLKNLYKETCLNIAVQFQNIDIIKILLKNGADVNNFDFLGLTPLHIACNFDSCNIIKILLNYGANPNIQTEKFKNNALNICCLLKNIKFVKILLKFGVNINNQNTYGDTPLIQTIKNKELNIFKILLKYNPNIFLKNNQGKNAQDLIFEFNNLYFTQLFLKKIN